MPSYRLEFPLPPLALAPNGSHGHWSTRSAAVSRYREDCARSILLARQDLALPKATLPGMVTIDLEFYQAPWTGDGRYRPTDPDNAIASAKWGLDALVASGVLAGDSSKHITIGHVHLYRSKQQHKGKCALILTLWSQP